MPLDLKDKIKEQIDYIAEREKQLNCWEKAFFTIIKEQFTKKGNISVQQQEVIDTIYRQVTP